ncbi:MAG: 3-hydroxybutyryl-CoA dehydrogenase [Betaproteobacteria bacterium]|nr:MAG: 3-hydroxybutyryl-CoA dehydrogenase [Betaproteobacteria bacterium]
MPAIIGALGAGRMGRGIAHAFAYAGHEVWLIDIKSRDAGDAARLHQDAVREIEGSLQTLADLGAFDAGLIAGMLGRIRFADLDSAAAALATVDVLFEGVPEVMDAKREAFAFACAHLRDDALIASTTSTMLSTDLATLVARPQRFLNAHWLNPAYLIPLVEVSPHPGTDAEAVAQLCALLQSIGKKTVMCQAVPGFIVPRFQAMIMNEAARMIEQGVATAEDIDRAVRYGFGPRYASMGVVEFIDFGGLDILYHASHYLARALDDPRYGPPAIVDRYMQEGRAGLRSGKGFFDWSQVDPVAYRREVMARQLALLRQLDLVPAPGPSAPVS